MKTLVPLSGGYDSTAVLHRLLTETDDRVHIHHLAWTLGPNDNRAEMVAVRKIVPWLYRNTRRFTFSTSVYASSIGCGYAPLVHLGVVLGQFVLARQGTWDRIVIGSVGPQDARSQGNNDIAEGVFAAMVEHRLVPPAWVYPFQGAEHSKRGLILGMPGELRDLCWTCKRPVTQPDGSFRPCGVCSKCEELREAMGTLDAA